MRIASFFHRFYQLISSLKPDVHAFLAWFDISFECTHTKVRFSTGPHAQYTHWKCVPPFCTTLWLYAVRDPKLTPISIRQTVFYTPNTLTVSQGESITGELSCAPNGRNPRDLDIKISFETPNEKKETVDYKMCVVLPFDFVEVWSAPYGTYADGLSGPDDQYLLIFLALCASRAAHDSRLRLAPRLPRSLWNHKMHTDVQHLHATYPSAHPSPAICTRPSL